MLVNDQSSIQRARGQLGTLSIRERTAVTIATVPSIPIACTCRIITMPGCPQLSITRCELNCNTGSDGVCISGKLSVFLLLPRTASQKSALVMMGWMSLAPKRYRWVRDPGARMGMFACQHSCVCTCSSLRIECTWPWVRTRKGNLDCLCDLSLVIDTIDSHREREDRSVVAKRTVFCVLNGCSVSRGNGMHAMMVVLGSGDLTRWFIMLYAENHFVRLTESYHLSNGFA